MPADRQIGHRMKLVTFAGGLYHGVASREFAENLYLQGLKVLKQSSSSK